MEEKKPEEGDFCKKHLVILAKRKGEIWPCNVCKYRCPHSAKKEETDYLVKKRKEV